MAARLNDRKKKKILADYSELESYSATARLNGVSKDTVRRLVASCADFAEKAQKKKEENTADILAYMESKREKVCDIIGLYLDELTQMDNFKNLSPNQLTTALGTLIDKWAMIGGGPKDEAEEDDLSRSLREFGEGLESDV